VWRDSWRRDAGTGGDRLDDGALLSGGCLRDLRKRDS
jgi:hypothetical protein